MLMKLQDLKKNWLGWKWLLSCMIGKFVTEIVSKRFKVEKLKTKKSGFEKKNPELKSPEWKKIRS